MKLIGLVGKKYSGKDATYEAVQAIEGNSWGRFAFADAMKKEVASACGVTVDYINQHKAVFRPILQWWGTEFRRGQDPNYWVKKADIWYAYVKDQDLFAGFLAQYVITDVRFSNEAAWIKSKGGILARIIRPSILGETDLHASETEQDLITCDYVISNWGALDDLRNEVVSFMRRSRMGENITLNISGQNERQSPASSGLVQQARI